MDGSNIEQPEDKRPDETTNPESSENQTSHLEQGVLILYKDAEQVTKTLQDAALRDHPALDSTFLYKEYGLDLESDYNNHQDTLDAMKKGEVSATYWLNRMGGGTNRVQTTCN